MQLSARQQYILKAVVDNYIATAEPVGSKVVADSAVDKMSSATVRNEMSLLEDLGFLIKPHRSAGRIPTDKAYREYIDNLMTLSPLKKQDKDEIRYNLYLNLNAGKDLLDSANKTLSAETGYVVISLSPSSEESYLSQFKLIYLDRGKALVIVVLAAGIVNDKIIRISDSFTASDLLEIAKNIEAKFIAKNPDDIDFSDFKDISTKANVNSEAIKDLYFKAYLAIKEAKHLDVLVSGLENLIVQDHISDFAIIAKMQRLLADEQSWLDYLLELSNVLEETDQDYTVRIGSELEIKDFKDGSLAFTTYKLGDKLDGNMAVIGPKRMDYETVLPKLSFISQTINAFYYQDDAVLNLIKDYKLGLNND